MRKGKHVLTEKLMAQTVAECKEMARVAKETRLYLATGHQRHYSILYDNAIHTIKNGLLGDLHHIRAQWHRNNLPGDDSWQPPMPIAGKGLEKLTKDIAGAKKRVADAEKSQAWADLEKNKKRLAQLQKQLEDKDVQAESFGYHGQGARRRQVQAIGSRRADSLATLGAHRRRPDGRARQPPARCFGHFLHRRPTRR